MATPATGRPTGRPPAPAEKQRLLGNPGKRALAPVEAVGVLPTTGKPPRAPKGLEAEGRAAWRRIWRAGSKWLAPESDYDLVTLVVRGLDERTVLADYLASQPIEERWYTTDKGAMGTHPAVTQLRQLDAQLTAWLSQLGFTPSDRTRLGLAQVRTVNELDAYRARAAARSAGRMEAGFVDAEAVARD